MNNSEPLPALDSMTAVRDAVDRVIADVYSGKLHPRIAAGLAPLLQLQLRALDAAEMEGRLSKLERLVTKREQSSKNNRGEYRSLIAPRTEPPSAPEASREIESESGSRITKAEEGLRGEGRKDAPAINEAERPSEPQPVQYPKVADAVPAESGLGRRIQDKAARALETETVAPVRIQEALPTNSRADGPIDNTVAQPPKQQSVQHDTNTTKQPSPAEIREMQEKAIQEGWAQFPPKLW